MSVEVTIVLRFEHPPNEREFREELEYEYECDVVEYEEEEV